MSAKFVTSILLTASLLAGCSQDQASNANIAREMVESGNFEESVVYLKIWVAEQPDNVEARILLGEALKNLGNPDAALKEFFKAHELNGDFKKYGIDFLELLAIKGAFEEILLLVEDVTIDDDELARALKFYEAYSLFEIQQDNKAILLLATMSKAFDSPYFQISQALIYWASDDYQNTIRMATNALQIKPDMYLAREFRANALLQLNRYESAMEDLVVLATSPVKNVKVDLQRAQALIQLGQYEEALVLVNGSLTLFPDAVITNQLKAILEFWDEKLPSAKTYSEKALSKSRNSDVVSLLIAAASNLLLNNNELALDQAKRLENYIQSPVTAELYDIAKRQIDGGSFSILGSDDRIAIHKLVSRSLGFSENVEGVGKREIELVQKIDIEQLSLLGSKLSSQSLSEVGTLDLMFDEEQGFTDNQLLSDIKSLIEQKKFNDALLLSNQSISKESSVLELQTHLVVLVLNNNFIEAKNFGITLLESGDLSAATLVSLTKAYLGLNSTNEAIKTIDLAIKHHPSSVRVLNTLFDFPIEQVRSRISAFERAYENDKNGIEYAFLLAKFYAAEKNAAEVIKFLEPHKEVADKNFNEYWLLLTDSLILAERHQSALETAIFWMQLDPSNKVAFNKLLNLAELYEDYRAALGLIEMKIAQKGPSDFLRLLKSGYLLKLNQSDSALTELKGISKEIKASSQWEALMSRALFLNGELDKALTLSIASYNERPSPWNTSTILGVYIRKNNTSEFERFAENHIIKYPNDKKTLEALFSYYYPDKLQKALSVAQRIYSLSSTLNWKNNVAWLQLELNNPEKAELFYSELLNSDSSDHNDTAARIALALGKSDEVLAQAQKRVERSPNLFYRLTLVELYLKLGKTSAANEALKNISPIDSPDFKSRYEKLKDE